MGVVESVTSSVSSSDLVAHLYRCAGFGALPDELRSATAAGYGATVSALVAGLTSPDAGADAIAAPTFSSPVPEAELKSMDLASRRDLARQLHQEFDDLTDWWLSRMLATSNPLKEKLTFLLHTHFPTAISKVRYPVYMYGQNQIFRTQGSGDFTSLTQAVAQDPAMLIWLDANSNKASNRTRTSPESSWRLHDGDRLLYPGRRAVGVLLLHRLAPRPEDRSVRHRGA